MKFKDFEIRPACFLDGHIVKIGEIADVIKKKTGIEFSKFKRN